MGGLGVAPGMKALLNFDNRQKAALEVAMEEKKGADTDEVGRRRGEAAFDWFSARAGSLRGQVQAGFFS